MPTPTPVRELQRFVFRFGDRWIANDGFGLAAAFCFYTLFSLAPMMAFAIALSGYFLGIEDARAGVAHWLENYIESDRAQRLVELVYVQEWTRLNWFYTGLTGLFFAWGSSIAILRLRIAVNILLGVEMGSIKRAIRNSVRGRLLSIAFTLGAGVLVAAFIVIVGATPLVTWLSDAFDGPPQVVVQAMSLGFLGVVAFVIVRFLPTYAPSWKSSAVSTVFIVLLFELGRVIFNIHVSRSELFSAYGAANTLVVFLLWLFYSAQALLLGVNLAATLDEARSGAFTEPPNNQPRRQSEEERPEEAKAG